MAKGSIITCIDKENNFLYFDMEVCIKFILLIIIFIPFQAFDMLITKAKIVEITESGRSIVLDKGIIDDISEDDFAFFYDSYNFDITTDNFKLKDIGRGKVVKLGRDYSFWYLRQIKNPDSIKMGKTIYFVPRSQIMKGRRKIDIEKNKTVMPYDKSIKTHDKEKRNGIPDRFIKKMDNYTPSSAFLPKREVRSGDMISRYYNGWREGTARKIPYFKKNLESRYFDEVSTKNSAEIVSDAKNYDVYISSTKSSVENHNEMVQNAGVYQDDTLGENWMNDEKVAVVTDPSGRWSDDMSDEHIRRFMVDSGISREKKRQIFAVGNSISNEFFVRYNMGLIKHYSKDLSNNQSAGKFWVLGVEYQLIRLAKSLKKWTIEASWSQGTANYFLEDTDISSTERYYSFFANYYVYNYPSSIYQLQAYLGAGMAFGSANCNMNDEEYFSDYSASAFPIFTMGIKYRFSAKDELESKEKFGFGLNTKLSYESIKFASRDIEDSIGTFTINDLKFSLGMSIFF